MVLSALPIAVLPDADAACEVRLYDGHGELQERTRPEDNRLLADTLQREPPGRVSILSPYGWLKGRDGRACSLPVSRAAGSRRRPDEPSRGGVLPPGPWP